MPVNCSMLVDAEPAVTLIVPSFVMPPVIVAVAPAGTNAVLLGESVTPLKPLPLSNWISDGDIAASVPPVSVLETCTVPPEARIVPELLTAVFSSKIPPLLDSMMLAFITPDSGVLSVWPGTLALIRP